MSKPVFLENKKNVISLLSAENAQRVVKVNITLCMANSVDHSAASDQGLHCLQSQY